MSSISYLAKTRQAARLARFRRDVSGSTAIEFGFVCVPFVALMLAILQISMTFFAQQTLETASDKAVRQLVTGQAQNSGMTQAQFKALVCSNLPSFMQCARVMIDVQSVTSFSSASTAAPTITYDSNGNISNNWQYTPGAAGGIVIARIMYVWDVQSGPLGFDISTMGTGRRLLSAVNVFKTEPYV